MTKRMVIMLVAVAVVLGGIFGFQVFKGIMIKKFMSAMASPPQTVSTTKAAFSEWQPSIEAIGSLRAVKGADLSLEVSGVVDSISFKSGDDVEQGTRAAEAARRGRCRQARIAARRPPSSTRSPTSATSSSSRCRRSARPISTPTPPICKNANAQVAQQQAILDKKTLRAPFAGHLGIRAVDLGQYLARRHRDRDAAGARSDLRRLLRAAAGASIRCRFGQTVAVKVDAYPDQTFTGEISAINPKVDPSSRNVQIRATLKNPDHKLLPGMYATVDIATGAPQNYITLPQTAITYNPYGNMVYIVDNKGTDADGKPQLIARQTFVTTGATRGDQVAVLKGVKEGDTIVTAGQIKLHNGSHGADRQFDRADGGCRAQRAARPIGAAAPCTSPTSSSAGRCWRRSSA